MKAAEHGRHTDTVAAFVTTNSICQGLQVPILWPTIFATGHQIAFAHTSFKWANLASNNAGVTVAIVGISANPPATRRLFSVGEDGSVQERRIDYINAYLAPGRVDSVEQARRPISSVSPMTFGNMPRDGGAFILSGEERARVLTQLS